MLKKQMLNLLNEINNLTCNSARLGYESELFLDFGKFERNYEIEKFLLLKNQDSTEVFQGEYLILVHNFWRILVNRKLYCSFNFIRKNNDVPDCEFNNSYTKLSLLVNILKNKKVESIVFNVDTFDIVINFESDIQLEILFFNIAEIDCDSSTIYSVSKNPESFFVSEDFIITYYNRKLDEEIVESYMN